MAHQSIRLDPGALSGLIGAAYEAALAPGGWQQFADQAARAFSSSLGVFIFVDHQDSPNSFIVAGGLGDEYDQALRQRWRGAGDDDDYWWRGIGDRTPGTVRLGREIISPEIMRRTPLHEALGTPWGLEHFLFGVVASGIGAGAYFSLARTAHEGEFGLADKAIVRDMLLAHLRRSIALHRDVAHLRTGNALLSGLIDMAPYGVVVFDELGRPLFVNLRAETIFAAGAGLQLRNGALRTHDLRKQAELDWCLGAATEIARGCLTAPPPAVCIPGKRPDQSYRVVFTPLNPRQETAYLPPGSACMALIYDSRSPRPPASFAMTTTYGLTPAEVRLCELLYEGRTVLEATKLLQISRNTAKTHLGRIFDKTGVRSQVALLRLLTLGPQQGHWPGTPGSP